MKIYENGDNFKSRKHTLEVILQAREYKGKITMNVKGRCFGLDILQCFDPDCIDEDDVKNNDCNFCIDDEWFSCVLKDEDNNTCEIEDEMSSISDYIVKLEIIDCVIED